MSFKRILTLFYKDITLFFKGRRKIRKKAEILYFISLFVVAFFMAILYRRVKVQTGIFALTFTFFLYILMSFIFELKHFIFFEEDIRIVKRLPVLEKEYYTAKGLLIGLFGIIFTVVAFSGHSIGAYIWARTILPFYRVFFALLLSTFFSMAFAMFIYALLLCIFRGSDSADVVAKIQIALGIFFGLIFAFSPNLAPLLDAIDSGTVSTNVWFRIMPFAIFVDITRHFSVGNIIASALYIVFPLLAAILLGFNENETKKDDKVKELERFLLVKNRKKRGIYALVLTHLARSRITKRTLIAPTVINMVVLFLWSFNKDARSIIFFGVWTLVFMSVIASLGLFISDSYKAAWMLKKAPLLNGDLIAMGLNAGFLYIVIPYGVFILIVFLFKGIPLTNAILPTIYGLVVSYFFMQLLLIVRPSMLFSRAGFERGINSLKELFVSFVLVPMAAGFFNFLYKIHSFCFLKVTIVLFLVLGYLLNLYISKKSFKLDN